MRADHRADCAEAVIWNWTRGTDSSCTCAPEWKVRKKDPFTSPDPLTVVATRSATRNGRNLLIKVAIWLNIDRIATLIKL